MRNSISRTYPDWIAVVAFYEAVHLVEAGFRNAGKPNSHKHRQRNDRLKRDYPGVWRHFRPLWNLSKLARYEANKTVSLGKARFVIERRMPDLKAELEQRMGIKPLPA